MELAHTGLLMIAALSVLLLIGVPIGFSLAGAGMLGLYMVRPLPSIKFILSTFAYANSAEFAYVVVPLFLFMGHMAFSAGLSRIAFDAGNMLLGRLPGGLAVATIFGCAAFSTICGSSVATASTMAKVALPEMLRHGYRPRLAAGCVAAGGTLGVLIPPSGILVIYAIVTQVSLVKLFLAALVPGVLTAVVYMVGIFLMALRNPEIAGGRQTRRYSRREIVTGLLNTWEVALMFVVVMGSIYAGFATPIEAAAVGALMSLLAVLRRPGRVTNVLTGLRDTGSATCSIFMLLIGASLFSLGLNTSQLPQLLSEYVSSLEVPPYLLLVVILLPYLFLGMLLDGISLLLITVPLVFPIIDGAGISPILFGLLVTKAIEIGAITPPVGLNAFVVKSSVPDVALSDIFRGCLPFVIMEIIVIALMITFPSISLGLL